MNRKLFKYIAIFIFYLINIIVFVPLFRNYSIGTESLTNYLLLFLISLFFIVSYLYDPKFFLKKKFLIFASFVFYFLFSTLVSSNFHVFKRFYSVIYLLFYSISLDYFIKNKINIRVFVFPIIFLFPYFILVSLFFLESNPFLIRNVNFDTAEYNLLRFYGVLGYDHIYSLVILIPTLFSYIKTSHNIISKFFSFLILSFGTYLIFKAGFSLAILLFLPTLLISPFVKFVSKKYLLKIGFLSLIIMSFSVFAFLFFFNNSLYLDKISAFFQLLLDGGDGSILSLRILTYTKSIVTFLNNPFFGIIFSGPIQIDTFIDPNVPIGLHSMVFDFSALFGIFFIFFLFYLIFETHIRLIKSTKLFFLFSSSVLFLTVILFNVDFPLLGLIFYVLIPSIIPNQSYSTPDILVKI